MRWTSQPGSAGASLHPYPGSDGATTWKASAGSPPWAAGIGERTEHVEELDHRARPAVREHEREGVGLGGAHVQRVDAEPVDLRPDLREGVDPLGHAEVVAVGPPGAQLAHVGEGHALRPVVDRLGVGPARAGQAGAEVGDLVVADGDLEGRDLGARHGQPSADLGDGSTGAPRSVHGHHLGVEPGAESEAQAIGQRQPLASPPAPGGPFAVTGQDRLDLDAVADQQRRRTRSQSRPAAITFWATSAQLAAPQVAPPWSMLSTTCAPSSACTNAKMADASRTTTVNPRPRREKHGVARRGGRRRGRGPTARLGPGRGAAPA